MAKVVLPFIFSCIQLMAASQFKFSKYEIGANAGVFVYQGDLVPARIGSYKTLKPGLNLFVNRIVSPLFSLRTNLAIGGLKGDDARYSKPIYRQQRNLNFKTPAFEISELLVADMFRNNLSNRTGLSPYLFAGLGITLLHITRDRSRFNAEYFDAEPATLSGLAADEQHSLPTMIPVLPMGIGLRYPISSRVSLTAESSYRFTFTDYLDGFSKAANDSRRDSYMTHTIGVIYRFKNNSWMKCPTF